jgi:hypothetical protein
MAAGRLHVENVFWFLNALEKFIWTSLFKGLKNLSYKQLYNQIQAHPQAFRLHGHRYTL